MNKLHLVTGYMGEEHIHSADQGSFNASFFGGGEYVMEAGNQFEASIMDNNTVRILDGDALMKGRHLRIEPNTYADVTITTGTAGVNRNDLIVFQYSKDTSTDIESIEIVVIKGTEVEGTATDPAYTDGDILGGATFNQMPLYRVKVEGVVLAAVEPLFTVIPTYKKLAEQYAKQFEEACNTYLGALNILDTKEEIEANTKENQLAGALALKEVIASLSQIIEDNATIQYIHGTTDEIQIKDDSGNWHKYASGGLNWDGSLYREGNTYSDITGGWELQNLGGTPTLTFNTSDMTLKNNPGKSIVSTNNKIDFSNYTKLHIEGSIKYSGGDQPYFEVGFGTSKNTMDTVVYSQTDSSTGNDAVTISTTVDISAYNSNPLYVQFCARPQNGNNSYNTSTLTNLYFLP